MKALVTGATGMIGRSLLNRLDQPVVLTREPQRARSALGEVTAFAWRPLVEPPPQQAFAGVEVVFHLAGEPVAAGRWTAAKKRAIRDSRVLGTRKLISTLKTLKQPPAVLVSASAIGYYGDRGDEELVEDAAPGVSFLGEVCSAWETEALEARELGVRVVTPRIGIVLSTAGGALARMLTPFKLGLGGPLGHGRQWMPWVHIDDLVALLLYAAQNEQIAGPMNAVAPTPVTNREFSHTLAQVLRRPALMPVPRLALRAAFGEKRQIMLDSQRVLPKLALDSGYRFMYPELQPALVALLAEQGA